MSVEDDLLEKADSSRFISSFDLLNDLSFCVFDLETTGGNHNYDKIIEIGLVKVKNLQIVSEVNYLINPQIQIPEFIQKLTSIRPENLVQCPRIEDVIDEIIDMMKDSILVAHNSNFDVPFFNSVLDRLNRPRLKNRVICTNLMTKYLIPNIMNSNLAYMSKIFDIPHDKAHRALEDARAAAELLLKYLNFFIEKNIRKVNQLYYPRNKFELDRCHIKREQVSNAEVSEKVKGIASPLFITFKGDKGVLLACVPLDSQNRPHSLLENFLALDWKTMTIQMTGSFFEALLQLNLHFNKLEENLQKLLLDYLIESYIDPKYLSSLSRPEDENKALIQLEKEISNFDFLITRHLVPHQLVIWPLLNLQPKNEMVFRWPSHRKKLLQYVQGHKRRLDNLYRGVRRSCIQKQLRFFFASYISQANKSGQAECFLFPAELVMKSQDQFVRTLENFLAKDPNPYDYPKKHI